MSKGNLLSVVNDKIEYCNNSLKGIKIDKVINTLNIILSNVLFGLPGVFLLFFYPELGIGLVLISIESTILGLKTLKQAKIDDLYHRKTRKHLFNIKKKGIYTCESINNERVKRIDELEKEQSNYVKRDFIKGLFLVINAIIVAGSSLAVPVLNLSSICNVIPLIGLVTLSGCCKKIVNDYKKYYDLEARINNLDIDLYLENTYNEMKNNKKAKASNIINNDKISKIIINSYEYGSSYLSCEKNKRKVKSLYGGYYE